MQLAIGNSAAGRVLSCVAIPRAAEVRGNAETGSFEGLEVEYEI